MFFFSSINCFKAQAYHEKKLRQYNDVKLRLKTNQIIIKNVKRN